MDTWEDLVGMGGHMIILENVLMAEHGLMELVLGILVWTWKWNGERGQIESKREREEDYSVSSHRGRGRSGWLAS